MRNTNSIRKLTFGTLTFIAISIIIYCICIEDIHKNNAFDSEIFIKSSTIEVPPGFEVNNYGLNINVLLNSDRHNDTNESDLKTILMWNNMEGSRTYGFGHTRNPFYEFKCPETRFDIMILLSRIYCTVLVVT